MCSMRYAAKIQDYQSQPAWKAKGCKSCLTFDYWVLLIPSGSFWVLLDPSGSFLAPSGSLSILYIQVEVLHLQWLLWLLRLQLQWLLAVSSKISEIYLYFYLYPYIQCLLQIFRFHFSVCGMRPSEVRSQTISAEEAFMQRFNRLAMISIGGEDAKMHAYPWMVQIKQPKYDNVPICGGAVINSRS